MAANKNYAGETPKRSRDADQSRTVQAADLRPLKGLYEKHREGQQCGVAPPARKGGEAPTLRGGVGSRGGGVYIPPRRRQGTRALTTTGRAPVAACFQVNPSIVIGEVRMAWNRGKVGRWKVVAVGRERAWEFWEGSLSLHRGGVPQLVCQLHSSDAGAPKEEDRSIES
ncbi:hypothetical protein BCR34DRAFT_587903 [Clohesyomyces aquaticus]|uniref:Uncharacterized protein n=1 Tax=Clohesyomyces aquaticus TaxID=1231657 RepID=A0A1Y1ZME0_9PLEO|nr:hypothetical protein BCR34DRAFT_587903 [Clohesyomyces aquaticus]